MQHTSGQPSTKYEAGDEHFIPLGLGCPASSCSGHLCTLCGPWCRVEADKAGGRQPCPVAVDVDVALT